MVLYFRPKSEYSELEEDVCKFISGFTIHIKLLLYSAVNGIRERLNVNFLYRWSPIWWTRSTKQILLQCRVLWFTETRKHHVLSISSAQKETQWLADSTQPWDPAGCARHLIVPCVCKTISCHHQFVNIFIKIFIKVF